MGEVVRKQDWAEQLATFLEDHHAFDWAKCNCGLFSANAVKAMTGFDYAKEYRGIKTKRGMLAKLGREHDGDVCGIAAAKLGEEINIRLAKRGDVVAAIFNGENALGICTGSASVFLSEFDGLIRIPTGKCIKAWKI